MKSQPPSFGKNTQESQSKAESSVGKPRPSVLAEQSFHFENRASTKGGPPSFSKKSDQSTVIDKISSSKRLPDLPSFMGNSKVKITENPNESIKPHQSGDTELMDAPKGIDYEAATKKDGHPTTSPLSQPTAPIMARPGFVGGIEKPETLKRGNPSPLDAKSSVEEPIEITESTTQFESHQASRDRSVTTNFKVVDVDVDFTGDGQENKYLNENTNLSGGPVFEGISEASDKSWSTCPNCEGVLRPGVKICVGCGLDLAYNEGKTKPKVGSPFSALESTLPAKPVVEEKGSQDSLKPAQALIQEAAGLQAIEDEPKKASGEPPVKVAPAEHVIMEITTSLSSEVASGREGRKPIPEQLVSQTKSELKETPVTESLKASKTAQVKQVGTETLEKPTSSKLKPKRNVPLVAGVALAGVVGIGVTAWLWVSSPSSTGPIPYAAPVTQIPVSAPEVAPAKAPAPAIVDLQPAAKPAEPATLPIPEPLEPVVAKSEPKVRPPPKSEPKPEPVANPSAKPPQAKTVPRKELNERDKQLMDKANKTLDDLLK